MGTTPYHARFAASKRNCPLGLCVFLLGRELLENLARNAVRGLLTGIPDPRKNRRFYLALRVMPKLLATKEENRYGRRLGRQQNRKATEPT